ncbi:hypothetical protein [uncultured Polaribacter sp.]|uniref:hypothetical protein n=1 Tax=uncultured Polaribacter sp. TaxID=174711 RepID=UPI00259B871D|nr:hypothetical protein [uncultured Polaribacter sp.]
MTKIDERKNIIVSLKPTYKEENKGIEKRIQFLKGMTLVNIVLTIISAGIIVLSILAEIIDYEIFKWQKLALMVILSLSFIMNLPNQFYELKLLKHLKNINSKSEFDGIDKLNSELKIIIDKLNNRFKSNWSIIFLAFGILIMGIWQVLIEDKNPYWNYMKLPILAFYAIILFRFINTNKRLYENITETEKHCS